MGWKEIYVSIIVGVVSSFLSVQDKVFSSDVYFVPQEINERLLQAIEGCRESLDIAGSEITSRDIVNALGRAKERGVQVRIVVDRKRILMKGPLSKYYKSKAFAIKILIQKRSRYTTFAIFDSRLLVTGSYSWNGNAGRLDRFDTIFTDETKLVVKYQKEFDRLFHEGIIPDVKEDLPVSGKSVEEGADKLAARIPKIPDDTSRAVASNSGFVIKETPDGYIDMSFEEFNTIFGMASELSEEQKESLWSQCVGKKVSWNGKVAYLGWGLVTGWMMSVSYGDTNVEIKLNSAYKDHFSHVKYGNTVTYTGKLHSRVTRMFPYKLEDGDVLEIINTLPSPPGSTHGLVEDPYTVPVSQGPKKIFIVESFEDMEGIFGKESTLSDAQKDEAWKKYEGKYVSWSGQIVYKNVNVATGLRVGITQKERGEVEVKFSMAKKEKVLKFQDGDTVHYTGKLVKRCGSLSPFLLEDGDIITIKESTIGLTGM